jgi:hypothetical protein
MTAGFIPGLELARLFYAEQIRPLLGEDFPGLRHSAARIGPGSEVLGFDSPRSTDHDWGPAVQLFLADENAAPDLVAAVSELLADRLPTEFRGYPTVFAASGAEHESSSHWVEVSGIRAWLTEMLGFDPRVGVQLLDWLATPTQTLAEVTSGAVFHDGLAEPSARSGAGLEAARKPIARYKGGMAAARKPAVASGGGLAAARRALAWYPHDVWLYVLACQWQRIDQEEPFPGRCAEAGDELGSALVTARLARDLVRLVLLMQRRYPPYSKWLGTAFARTPAAAAMLPLLTGALTARSWPDREANLCAGYEAAARLHNELGLTPHVNPAVRPSFYQRPYRALGAGRFVQALRDAITDEQIRGLPLSGAVDQFIDNTDATVDLRLLRTTVAAQLGQARSRRE